MNSAHSFAIHHSVSTESVTINFYETSFMDYKLNTETTQKWKTSNKMIKYTIHLILPLLLFMFSACNLNKMYLQPTEMKPDAKSATLYLEGDTVTINYIGEHYQPQFIRNGKDTVEFDYTIESTLFESTSGNLLNGWMLTPDRKSTRLNSSHVRIS